MSRPRRSPSGAVLAGLTVRALLDAPGTFGVRSRDIRPCRRGVGSRRLAAVLAWAVGAATRRETAELDGTAR